MNTVMAKCDSCGVQNRIPEIKQHLRPRCGKCGRTIDMRRFAVPVELGDHDLGDFLSSGRLPVVVDFYSPVCGPCRMLAPVIDTVTRRFFGEVLIAKVDTTRHARSATLYNIKGVPTLLFFRDGKVADRMVGVPSESLLIVKIKALAEKE